MGQFRFMGFFLLFVPLQQAHAQTFYKQVDSITSLYLKELPVVHTNKFDSIIAYRYKTPLADSIDKHSYDCLIVEETFSYADSTHEQDLYYFSGNENEYDFNYSFYKKKFKRGNHIKENEYAHLLPSEHTRKCRKRHHLKQETKLFIESTYTIITMIHKTTGEVKVLLLYPPEKARICMFYIGGGKC